MRVSDFIILAVATIGVHGFAPSPIGNKAKDAFFRSNPSAIRMVKLPNIFGSPPAPAPAPVKEKDTSMDIIMDIIPGPIKTAASSINIPDEVKEKLEEVSEILKFPELPSPFPDGKIPDWAKALVAAGAGAFFLLALLLNPLNKVEGQGDLVLTFPFIDASVTIPELPTLSLPTMSLPTMSLPTVTLPKLDDVKKAATTEGKTATDKVAKPKKTKTKKLTKKELAEQKALDEAEVKLKIRMEKEKAEAASKAATEEEAKAAAPVSS